MNWGRNFSVLTILICLVSLAFFKTIFSNITVTNNSGFDFVIFYQNCDNLESVGGMDIKFRESKKIDSNENDKFGFEFLALNVKNSVENNKNLILQFSKDNFPVFDGDNIELSFDFDRANFLLLLKSKKDISVVEEEYDAEDLQNFYCIFSDDLEKVCIKNISNQNLSLNILVGDYFRDFIVKPGENLNLIGRVYICKINDFDTVEFNLDSKDYCVDYIEISDSKKLILKYMIYLGTKIVKNDFYTQIHFV